MPVGGNKNTRTDLTPTGLLMEGVYAQNRVVSAIAILQQLRRAIPIVVRFCCRIEAQKG
jgi:hypothetical protein